MVVINSSPTSVIFDAAISEAVGAVVPEDGRRGHELP